MPKMEPGSGSEPFETAVHRLKPIYTDALGLEEAELDIRASFISLGGDSFKAIKICQRCFAHGHQVSFQQVLGSSLSEIATIISASSCGVKTDERLKSTSYDRHQRFSLMPPPCFDLSKIQRQVSKRLGVEQVNLEAAVEDIYPCSAMQENMFVGQQTSERRNLYKTRVWFEVSCDFGLERIKAAWEGIVQKHAILRTIYIETPGLISQDGPFLVSVVMKTLLPKVCHVECQCSRKEGSCGQSGPRGCCEMLLAEQTNVYEDQLTVLSPCSHRGGKTLLCQLVLDHLRVDALSLHIILTDMNALLLGSQSLPDAVGKYSDYISYLKYGVDEARTLEYWTEYLDDLGSCEFPNMTEGSTSTCDDEKISPCIVSSKTCQVPFDESIRSLRRFCKREKTTIFNVIQAAWATVLHMYLGTDDVCFGYVVSGRDLPVAGVDRIVGPMMNLLACRVPNIFTGTGTGQNNTTAQLLSALRDDFQHSIAHQCLPMRGVRRVLGTSAGSRLFDTMITCFYSAELDQQGQSKLGAMTLLSSDNASDFDLVLKVVYSDTSIRIRLDYSTGKLSASAANSVCSSVGAVLERMTTCANAALLPVATLATISAHDLGRVTSWNQRTLLAAPPKPPSRQAPCLIHELVDQACRRAPQAPAVCAWDGDLTYAELDKLSSQLASQIVKLVPGPNNAVIPVFFEKSKWYSVAILGILKSGHAFSPIDVTNPLSRIKNMVEQLEGCSSGANPSKLVLCSPNLCGRLESLAGWRTLVVGDSLLHQSLHVELETAQQSLLDIRLANSKVAKATDIAYVIFTSGSTGNPKGCVVEHEAYAFAARAHSARLRLGPASRVLQFAAYGFDTSIEDHLSTFCAGACLCVPSEQARLNIPDLARFASHAGANWAHLTPSFAELVSRRQFPTIRTMVLGGEPMSRKNMREWAAPQQQQQQHAISCSRGHGGRGEEKTELIQVYGPSECCVTSTVGPCVTSCDDLQMQTDIGTALDGCATWVVAPEDPNRLCAIGAVGELLVEGPILARGYLHQSTSTSTHAEDGLDSCSSSSFLTGLAWNPEKRVYRTGDHVKYDDNGHLHFVGRKGHQIKIHGQRVELGEIQQTLTQNPNISSGLIVAPTSGPCAGRLVAMVSLAPALSIPSASGSSLLDGDEEEDEEAIRWEPHFLDSPDLPSDISSARGFLLDRLAPHMVPEIWLMVAELPKNSSAKMDRKKVTQYLETLPRQKYRQLVARMTSSSSMQLEHGSSTGGQQKQQRPGTESEVAMRRIWSDVLNVPVDEILWTSSFFYLGGDSISAMAVSSAAREQGFAHVTTADVMRHRTIEQLMAAVPPLSPSPGAPPCSSPKSDYVLGSDDSKSCHGAHTNSSSCTCTTNSSSSSVELATSDETCKHSSDQESHEPFELSPIQRLHFYAAPFGDALDQQTVVLKTTRAIDQEKLRAGLEALLRAHPMLRASFFTKTQAGPDDSDLSSTGCSPSPSRCKCAWSQAIRPQAPMEETVHTKSHPNVQRGVRIRHHSRVDEHGQYVMECLYDAKQAINILEGPLVAVDVFHKPTKAAGQEEEEEEGGFLSITIHHLVVDAVSWRILLRQLENWLSNGEPIVASENAMSFRGHCLEQMQPHAPPQADSFCSKDSSGARSAAYALALQREYNGDMVLATNTFGNTATRRFAMGASLVRDILAAYEQGTQQQYGLTEILCAVALDSFKASWGRFPRTWIEGHGRGGGHFSSSVGWFTEFSPVRLEDIEPESDHEEGAVHWERLLARVREARPGNGRMSTTSSFPEELVTEDQGKQHFWPMEMAVNFLGGFQQVERPDSLFTRCGDALQAQVASLRRAQRANATRYSLISILAVREEDGTVSVEVEWHRNMRPETDILGWIRGMEDRLRTLPVVSSSPARNTNVNLVPRTIGLPASAAHALLQALERDRDVAPGDVEAICPCSPLQESLILSQLRSPRKHRLYSQRFMFRVYPRSGEGDGDARARTGDAPNPPLDLNPARLARAWQAVVKKHSILRTVFHEHLDAAVLESSTEEQTTTGNGNLNNFWQVVLRQGAVTPAVETSRIDSVDDEAELGRVVWAKEMQAVDDDDDATRAPLSGRLLHQLNIYYTDQGSLFCVLRKNHVLTDAVTTRLLVHDFLTAAALEDPLGLVSSSSLVPTSQQQQQASFADYMAFICAQRERLGDSTKYWTAFLDGFDSCYLFPHNSSMLENKTKTTKHVTHKRLTSSLTSSSTCSAATPLPLSLFSALSASHGVTTSVILQTAWALTLGAYLGRERVLFGVLYSGRDAPVPGVVGGARSIAGPMAVMLPARAELQRAPGPGSGTTLLALMEAIQRDYLGHLGQLHVPLSAIQHVGARGGGSLFNTILNIQMFEGLKERDTGTIGCELLQAHDASEYDIALSITSQGVITLEYPDTFMTNIQAEGLLETFKAATRALIANPLASIADTNLLTDMDEARIRAWNNAQAPELEDKNRCVHELVWETCARFPTSQAICSWDGNLTYAELEHLSTKLALNLVQHMQAGPSESPTVVALCFEKSMWAVVAMLAVSRTGAAFVHIDPDGPVKRLKVMVEQTGATICLTSPLQLVQQGTKLSSLVQSLAPERKMTIVAVSKESVLEPLIPPLTSTSKPTQLPPMVDPSHPFYIIFTSGSTGTPKGVVVPHRAFASAAAANTAAFEITPRETRMLQFAHYNFDESLEETFHALLAGATVCIPNDDERLADLPGFVQRNGVTWAALTPSFLRTLDPKDVRLRSLRFITVQGEAMTQALVRQWTATTLTKGQRRVIKNSYGPTECSVTSTISAALAGPDSDAANIGWPLGCRAWVVDPYNHHVLLPVGAVGELLIDGPIVSLGYLNNDTQTSTSFIAPPAWATKFASWTASGPGSTKSGHRRMYKTGDLVCYAEDGSLRYVGRRDRSMVKIRGQRVELHEIQAHLDSLPTVRHSIVLVPSAGPLADRLVVVMAPACASGSSRIVGRGNPNSPNMDHDNTTAGGISTLMTTTTNDGEFLGSVQAHLEAELPRYMLPEAWLVVDGLPMQPSQKLDLQRVKAWVEQELDQNATDQARQAAGQPWNSQQQAASAQGGPVSELEASVRAIWAAVLDIAPPELVSLDRPFFLLGGDSIYAIQVVQRCRMAKLPVTVKDMLANPTVRSVARLPGLSTGFMI